jgi:uncharacterized protein (DUF3084 family)
MAVRFLSYRDLSPEQRKKAAVTLRGQYQAAAANPFLSTEQRTGLVAQLNRLTQWERGTLPLGAPLPKS